MQNPQCEQARIINWNFAQAKVDYAKLKWKRVTNEGSKILQKGL